VCLSEYSTNGRTLLPLSALACCFLMLDPSRCPLRVGAGHTQPSMGLPASSHRLSSAVLTLGVIGSTLRAAAVFPCVTRRVPFNQDSFSNPIQFFSRLKAFMKKLPRIGPSKCAVEIRNKWWLTKRFTDLLKEHNVALVLQDHSFMPSVERVFSTIDPITADFVYIRLLGDRKAIEAKTTVWNQVVEDRTASMTSWVDVCQMVQRRGIPQYVYFNNHYEGFAVASVERFRRLCATRGIETPLNVQLPVETEPTLFDISPN